MSRGLKSGKLNLKSRELKSLELKSRVLKSHELYGHMGRILVEH